MSGRGRTRLDSGIYGTNHVSVDRLAVRFGSVSEFVLRVREVRERGVRVRGREVAAGLRFDMSRVLRDVLGNCRYSVFDVSTRSYSRFGDLYLRERDDDDRVRTVLRDGRVRLLVRDLLGNGDDGLHELPTFCDSDGGQRV